MKLPAPVRPVETQVPLPFTSYSMALIKAPLSTTECTVPMRAPSEAATLTDAVAALACVVNETIGPAVTPMPFDAAIRK